MALLRRHQHLDGFVGAEVFCNFCQVRVWMRKTARFGFHSIQPGESLRLIGLYARSSILLLKQRRNFAAAAVLCACVSVTCSHIGCRQRRHVLGANRVALGNPIPVVPRNKSTNMSPAPTLHGRYMIRDRLSTRCLTNTPCRHGGTATNVEAPEAPSE